MKNRMNFVLFILAAAMTAFILTGCMKKACTVTFDPNGGELLYGELTQTVPEGGNAAPPVLKNGNMELTWEGVFRNVSGDSRVIAVWTKPLCTVTFDPAGGTVVSGSLTQQVEEGSDAVPPVLENNGMELSWLGSYTAVTGSASVRAVWTKPVFTVTFDPAGGTLLSGSLTQQVEAGGTASLPLLENGNRKLTWTDNYTDITADTTVTAQWSKPSYTVTFALNGGTLVSGDLTQTVEEGGSATPPRAENGNQSLTWSGSYTDVTSDSVVSARWTRPSHTVTFTLGGGTLVSGNLTQTVEDGGSATPPVVENGNMEVTWSGSYTNVTADTTVTAQWSKRTMDFVEVSDYTEARTVKINVTTITGGSSSGSGFFIDDQGTLATCYHVIDMAASISVEMANGGSYPVTRVIDFSVPHDVAILQIDMTGNAYLDITDSVKQGEMVWAVGSPLGESGTTTFGVISSLKRTVGTIDCLQTSAPISSGNSGGPLVNACGELVGINAYSYTRGENMNLAIKPEYIAALKRDKNWTMNDFREWYKVESDRSYSPWNEIDAYYYSLVNTYQTVTGADCLYSVAGDEIGKGYYDMCEVYGYTYDQRRFDTYVAYLKSIGFEYVDYENYSDGVSYYYYSEVQNGVLMDLFVTADKTELQVRVRVD